MFKNFLKLALICLTLTSAIYADGLAFYGRSEFYAWLEKGQDPANIDTLHLEDLWSSRRFDFHPKQHFENGDFALIIQTFPNIEYLTLKTTLHLNDESLKLLAHLPKLKGIAIFGDYIFSSFSSQAFSVIADAAPQLEGFKLVGPFPRNSIDGDSLINAIQNMSHLEQVLFDTSHHSCYFNNNIYQIVNILKVTRPSLPIFVNGKEVQLEFDFET